jgi:hypothetical protein
MAANSSTTSNIKVKAHSPAGNPIGPKDGKIDNPRPHCETDIRATTLELHESIRIGDMTKFEHVLKGQPAPSIDLDCGENGETALHVAADCENGAIVTYLIAEAEDRGLDKGRFVNAQDRHLETALHRAMESLYTPVIKELIDNGADTAFKNRMGETPWDICQRYLEGDMFRPWNLLTSGLLSAKEMEVRRFSEANGWLFDGRVGLSKTSKTLTGLSSRSDSWIFVSKNSVITLFCLSLLYTLTARQRLYVEVGLIVPRS